jgi:predicted NBD/HSP70 family sugar kinase
MHRSHCVKPVLDPDFIPAALWTRDYQRRIEEAGACEPVSIALLRPGDSCSVFRTRILPAGGGSEEANRRHMERTLKMFLWQRSGNRVLISGCDALVPHLREAYSPGGVRQFDNDLVGKGIYGTGLEIMACPERELPAAREHELSLGGNLDGCRIGFDLGGSDRKCAAVIDGRVVFSEEVEWAPYFEPDPAYHIDGIQDTLSRAAEHLPRVDAIGGSAAGVYVNNEVRFASLFRGVASDVFESRIRRLFLDLRARWGNVPFDVANDGEVTALAGAMSMKRHALLGLSMGTSLAAGYITAAGHLTSWINELAFAPLDYREDAPVDEWSGDRGVGAQYLSQQAVARLAPLAGFDFPDEMPYPEQLLEVQAQMRNGDARAADIYSTIGTYLGYSLAHYAEFYDIQNVLLLGRVATGDGGGVIIEQAARVLREEFPARADQIEIHTLNETQKRHGQAVAAASLPALAS